MISLIISGGVVLWLILAIGVAATCIFFIRYFDLRRAQVVYADFMAGVDNIIEKGNDREAIAVCEEAMVPVAKVIAAALRKRGERSDVIRESAEIAARGEIRRFSRRLSVLLTVSQVSPLLGLFGAIVGFAKAMVLIGGKNLVTRFDLMPLMGPVLASAAAGLLVAVLVHVMYAVLRARLEHLTADLDAATNEITGRFTGGAK
ncbi:MAG: MotA/TolQ/ExbB proton channel family protein [Kiritimatiellae bacterium]|nr:MotA/TolQ/ExbB proton channel family protein [Kiritimatiellia bacterium]